MPHIYAPIDKDENIQHTLKIQHRRAEAIRYEKEGLDLLEKMRSNKKKLDIVADDYNVDTKLRAAARKTLSLEEKMREMKKRLRDDIRLSGKELKMDEDEASVIIQRLYKGWRPIL